MKARPQKPGRGDVRALMQELGELVDDFGLGEATTPAEAPPQQEPPALSAPPPPSAPVWRSGPEVLTGSAASALPAAPAEPVPLAIAPMELPELEELPALVELPVPVELPAERAELTTAPAPVPVELPARDAIPMWESAAPDAAVAAEWAAPATTELAGEPARRWSPAAAMTVVEPAAPPQRPRRKAAFDRPATPSRQRGPHAFTVVTALAVAVAAAVFAFSRLDLGRTTGPAQPVTQTAFAVDNIRVVNAHSPADVPKASTTDHFPANAAAVYLDVTYRDVSPSDTLRIVILLQPQREGAPALKVSDETHRNLDRGGEIAVVVQAPPGGFAPGSYEVRAFHDDDLEQTTIFHVDQPA